MATTYQAYGARPGSSNPYPSSLPSGHASPNYPPPDASSDSDASEDANALHYKPQDYSKAPGVRVDTRAYMRTPSPTPSETVELNKKGMLDWQAMKKRSYWFRREWLWYYVFITIALVLTILFTVFHKQIVKWLQPAANWMHGLPAGWLIPIAILFVISFPPLFGHEIIAILCGVVWGLWGGFAIVAAGTFIGEIGNFYAFRYCCSARGEKMEKSKIQYACLARVVREGGFKIALIARYSAIPGHFTTAVFSTCGMHIWVFMIAAFLSLPKQFITVYLGVALEDSEKGGTSTRDNIIKDVVLLVTTAVTFIAMWYIYHLMNKVKPQVIYERRKARQARMLSEAGLAPSGILQSAPTVPYDQNVSESELPLTANFNNNNGFGYQQWDSNGRAVGYAPDPTLYAPQPQRPAQPPSASAGGSGAGTPAMSERQPPSRQNTTGSAASGTSWDARAHVGGPDAYKMSAAAGAGAPPYRDPYAPSPSARASPAPARLPPPPSSSSHQQMQQQLAYVRTPSPMRAAVGEPTPTQPQYAYRPPAGPPPNAMLPNPYASAPPPPSYQMQPGEFYNPYASAPGPR